MVGVPRFLHDESGIQSFWPIRFLQMFCFLLILLFCVGKRTTKRTKFFKKLTAKKWGGGKELLLLPSAMPLTNDPNHLVILRSAGWLHGSLGYFSITTLRTYLLPLEPFSSPPFRTSTCLVSTSFSSTAFHDSCLLF